MRQPKAKPTSPTAVYDKSALRARLSLIEQRVGEAKGTPPSEEKTTSYNLFRGGPVRDTPELARILALPRKEDDDTDLQWLAREVTVALKRPQGEMTLRPVQAEALRDLSQAMADGGHRGIFCPARVGAGKTLISLLAATVLNAQRPLLLVPAKLVKKTLRDSATLAKHWAISGRIKVETYERVSRVQGALLLDAYQPDLIIADECHKLKNRTAAVTKRVLRYMEQQQATWFLALSGTITKRSLTDYGHILKWTHKEDRPVPRTYTELEEWALALDEKVNPVNRKKPGALLKLCNAEDLAQASTEPLLAVRRGFQRRLTQTPGVVTTPESDIDASIQVNAIYIPREATVMAAFSDLRHEWCRPDGVDLADPAEIYRYSKQMALGFYYKWNPMPPQAWMEARRAWNKFVRHTLANNQLALDSPLQVAQAVDRGLIDGQETLAAWREIEPTFKPVTETVWLTDKVLEQCSKWANSHAGIIWVEHVEFGQRLERDYGIVYYGRQGLDKNGRFIDDHPANKPLAASILANSEGRNLQQWNENLITSVMPNALQWEQVMGRTHRDGQTADEVGFDVLVGCHEHVRHFEQSVADARYQRDTLGQPQKLLLADVDMPSLDGIQEFLNTSLSETETQIQTKCGDCRFHAATPPK